MHVIAERALTLSEPNPAAFIHTRQPLSLAM